MLLNAVSNADATCIFCVHANVRNRTELSLTFETHAISGENKLSHILYYQCNIPF